MVWVSGKILDFSKINSDNQIKLQVFSFLRDQIEGKILDIFWIFKYFQVFFVFFDIFWVGPKGHKPNRNRTESEPTNSKYPTGSNYLRPESNRTMIQTEF